MKSDRQATLQASPNSALSSALSSGLGSDVSSSVGSDLNSGTNSGISSGVKSYEKAAQSSAAIPTKYAILFVHYGDEWIRGSEQCLIDLLSNLNRELFQPVLWCNNQAMKKAALALDIEVFCQPFPLLLGWKAPFFDFKGFFKLIKNGRELVNKYNIKLIHSNSGAPCQWLNFVARSSYIPLLAHLHSRYPLRDRLTLGLSQVSKAITVSQPVAQQLLDDGMPDHRVKVIANGIDSKKFQQANAINLRKLLNLEEQDFIIFSTGSLIKRKGMDLLITATALIKKSGLPIKLVIAGDGIEKRNLAAQIAQLGLQSDVFLLGERTDLPGLLKGGVDIFVSGAREEAFGLVLAEAGLNALPVIAPAVGGIPCVIKANETGLLIPVQGSQSMVKQIAENVQQLYHQPQLRKQLGLAAKYHVKRNFLIERNVKNIEHCYLTLLTHSTHNLTWFSHWNVAQLVIKLFKAIPKPLLKRSIFSVPSKNNG